jgi:lysophospholipase L1-like esterase
MKYRILLAFLIFFVVRLHAEHDGKIQILLLGDSTAEAKIPKMLAPNEPQHEDIIRILLAAEGDLPPTNVINLGLSGEYIRRLLDTGRYDKEAAKLPGIDYILIRYGLNDVAHVPDFDTAFPKSFHELLARLRQDHPGAVLIPMTVIPMAEDLKADELKAKRINDLVRQVAVEEKLSVLDVYPRYAAEQAKGPNMLNYRRMPLAKIPEKFRELVKPYVVDGKDPYVVVLDNRLDAHLGNLPGWYGDRHPNLAGYHVIADETAKYLAPLIRERIHAAAK